MSKKLRYINITQDYIISQENGSDNFCDTTSKLLKAYALVSTHERIDTLKDDMH